MEEKRNVLTNVVDDKGLVIFCATLLGMASLMMLGTGAVDIIREIVVGLFGVAVGRSMVN